MIRKICLLVLSVSAIQVAWAQPSNAPMNIVFILSDDHRYDAMGFMNKIKGLQTPAMDRMAKEGAHLKKCLCYYGTMLT